MIAGEKVYALVVVCREVELIGVFSSFEKAEQCWRDKKKIFPHCLKVIQQWTVDEFMGVK